MRFRLSLNKEQVDALSKALRFYSDCGTGKFSLIPRTLEESGLGVDTIGRIQPLVVRLEEIFFQAGLSENQIHSRFSQAAKILEELKRAYIDKTHTLNLFDEDEVLIVMAATETYSRVGMGQYDDVYHQVISYMCYGKNLLTRELERECRDLLKQAESARGSPSSGISHMASKSFKLSWDLYQVVRYTYNNVRRDSMNEEDAMNLFNRTPLPVSDSPLPKMESI